MSLKNIKIKFKVWLEYEGEAVLGKGGASLLNAVKKYRNLVKAAKYTGMSYRKAWFYLKRMAEVLHEPVVETRHGGSGGGGETKLTALGEFILQKYQKFESFIKYALKNSFLWTGVSLRSEKVNVVEGEVSFVKEGKDAVMVEVETKSPVTISSIITVEAVEELKLEVGSEVQAFLKATEVNITT